MSDFKKGTESSGVRGPGGDIVNRRTLDLSAGSPVDFTKRSIIIADDEASIRDLLNRIVTRRLGCSTRIAATGDEALELLGEAPTDILITDMVMPGTHGLELLSAVRKGWPDVAIIVMTGFTEEFPFVEVVHAGASEFLAKPFPAQEVEAKLLRILQERHLREQLIRAERQYRSLFEFSLEGNVLLDPESFEIRDANRSFCEMIGRERNETAGASLFELIASDDRERVETAFEIFAGGGQGTIGDVVLCHTGGAEQVMDISVTFIDERGGTLAFLTFRDVTELRIIENQLKAAAETDTVTGLSNKRTLNLRLEATLLRARQDETPVALMFIDLDNFKQCNDEHGHQVGDELLRSVGVLIRLCIRDGRGDEGFRYGGDEFAVMLAGATKEGARVVGERMRTEFQKGQCYGTTMSIGIAEFSHEMRANALIEKADSALYQAKAGGKNTVHVV